MGIGDRHQKKDVESALRRAEARGLKVTHDKNRHRWGYVICCPCEQSFTVHCTPSSAGDEARRIDAFTRKHGNCA
ncbi:hypothetical protein [Streptomyces sp. NPDC014894]|uniref:hypothetical protein n=1 Tax=unclassified Streptomyces TaxID=2593676 RepID=UPI0036FBBC05